MLIDSSTNEYNIFYDSANNNTFPIIYNHDSTREDLSAIIHQLCISNAIDRLVFVFEEHFESVQFLEQEPLFTSNDLSSTNTQFLVDIINDCTIASVDFLACNLLHYTRWVSFFDLLEANSSTIVGASDDLTGNIKFGGDWELEKTTDDIKSTYFTSEINSYSELLALTVYHTSIIDTSGFLWSTGLKMGESATYEYVFTKRTDISNLACSSSTNYATVALTTNNELYVVGWDNGTSFFGNGSTNVSYPTFQNVDISNISGTPIQVVVNGYVTMIRTTEGDVYGAGRVLTPGILGDEYEDPHYKSFVKLDISNVQDIQLTSGSAFFYIDTNTVYMTGYVGGLPYGDDWSLGFRQLTDVSNIAQIAPGLEFVTFLTNDGDVYGAGRNVYGALGNDDKASSTTFGKISDLSNIQLLQCGSYTTIALSTDGTLYGSGWNVGFGNDSDGGDNIDALGVHITQFTPITLSSSSIPEKIICYYASLLVITEDGTFYTAGSNSRGQLANNVTDRTTQYLSLTEVNDAYLSGFYPNLIDNEYDKMTTLFTGNISTSEIKSQLRTVMKQKTVTNVISKSAMLSTLFADTSDLVVTDRFSSSPTFIYPKLRPNSGSEDVFEVDTTDIINKHIYVPSEINESFKLSFSSTDYVFVITDTNILEYYPSGTTSDVSGKLTFELGDSVTPLGTDEYMIIFTGIGSGSFSPVENPPCFIVGTRVLTSRGYKQIQNITKKDKLVTSTGKWVRGHVVKMKIPEPTKYNIPWCVPANSISPGIPKRDIWMSPWHAIQLHKSGIWTFPHNVKKAYSDSTFLNKPFIYYNIRTPSYKDDTIIIENMSCETYGRDFPYSILYKQIKNGKYLRYLRNRKLRLTGVN
jgi:alpha-tubulin suppressor-like RCC1 family protein